MESGNLARCWHLRRVEVLYPSRSEILHVFYGIHHQYPAFDVSGQAQLTLSHPRYGQHLIKGQVDALSAPHPDSTGLVEDWLSHHDLLHDPESQLTRSSSGDWISLCVPVGQLEQMLGTKYHVYKHSATETTIIRTIGYSLPSILHDHVTVVTPSTYFGHRSRTTRPRSFNAFRTSPRRCWRGYEPCHKQR